MKIQAFSKYRDLTLIQPQRVRLVIPAFTLDVHTWDGASSLLAEFPLSNDYALSIRKNISVFGANFVPAIRWQNGDIWARYKFFEDVGEILYYPVYSSQRIGENATIEIWSVNSASAPTLAANQSLEISLLVTDSSSCCSCCNNVIAEALLTMTPPTTLAPGASCNPLCITLSVP